jgi:hypothetical protein
MMKIHKLFCCECQCQIVVQNSGASRVLSSTSEKYWLCVGCLKLQPHRPKWEITLIGLAAIENR